MGNIPTFATPVGAVPAVQGVPLAETSAFAAPAAAQARVGAEAADMGMQFAQKYITAKLEVDAADQTADLSKALQQAEFNASKIPDRMKATEHYDAATQKIFDGYEQSGANPLVKAHVSARFRQEQTLRRAGTQQQAFQLESQTQRGKLITQLDQWGKEAATARDPRLRDKLIEDGIAAIDGRVAGGWMNPEAGAKAKVDFESGVYRSLIDVEMAKNPRMGVAMFDLYKGKLNSQDGHMVGVAIENARVETKAEDRVNSLLPPFGGPSENNIGNVRPRGGGPASGFRQVGSFNEGVALAVQNVRAYPAAFNGGQSMTLQQIGTRWAPKGDGANDPGQWAKNVAAGSGLPVDQPLDMNDPEIAAKFARGVHLAEWGSGKVRPLEDYKAGVGTKPPVEGDELATYRTRALEAELKLVRDQTIDPRERQRSLALLQLQSRTTEGLVLSQRKQLADTGETASLGLFDGSYVVGSFAKIAQGYRDTGDHSQAGVYDWLAKNEGGLRDFASLPPGAQRTLSHVLPGAAGKIAQSIIAEGRTDRKEFRELAAQQHKLLTDGMREGVDAAALARNASDAAGYYIAAGDRPKAQEILATYQGMVDGQRAAGKPTVEAEEELRRLKEIADGSTGLDAKTSAALQALEKGITKNREKWDNDPISAAERYTGTLDAYKPGMSATDLQLWANKRVQQANTAQYIKDQRATVQTVPMLTQTEIAAQKTLLMKGSVQDRQIELARMATAMPAEQVPLVAQKIAGNDKLGDSWATAMAFYKRNLPGDSAIADSLVAGSNLWVEGGAEGREKLALDPTTFSQIDGLLGTARAGMDGRDRDMQNNAIASRYVGLMGSKAAEKLNTTVLNQAVKDIVGTAMTYHGSQHILPTNVQPFQFEDGIAGMTQADLPPLRPAGTTDITVDRIKRSATYQSVGDGLYKVWMPDPKAGGTHEVIRSDTGKPWIIDIRPLIARGGAGSLQSTYGVMPQGPQ